MCLNLCSSCIGLDRSGRNWDFLVNCARVGSRPHRFAKQRLTFASFYLEKFKSHETRRKHFHKTYFRKPCNKQVAEHIAENKSPAFFCHQEEAPQSEGPQKDNRENFFRLFLDFPCRNRTLCNNVLFHCFTQPLVRMEASGPNT